MATFTKTTNAPSSVEGGRGDGVVYEVLEGEVKTGYVAHIGFYSDTWTASTPLGTFVGEYDTRKDARQGLLDAAVKRGEVI